MFGIFLSEKFSLYNNTPKQEKNQEHFGYIDVVKITVLMGTAGMPAVLAAAAVTNAAEKFPRRLPQGYGSSFGGILSQFYYEKRFIAEETIRPIPPTITRISTTSRTVSTIFVPDETFSEDVTSFA